MSQHARLRTELAQRIAAEIAESDSDWARARELVLGQAREQLGKLPAGAVPTSSEIESAVRAHFALYDPERHAEVLAAKRRLALETMHFFSDFRVYLTGAVLNGAANNESNICLEIFCDDVKAVETALLDAGIEFEPVNFAGGAMGDPLESLGFLVRVPEQNTFEGIRLDIHPAHAESRNPYHRKPDAHQHEWEACGRISHEMLKKHLCT